MKGILGIVASAGLIAVSTAGTTPAERVEANEVTSPVFDPSVVRGVCDVDCYQPHTCDECEHKAPYIGENEGSHDNGGGAHSYCFAGNCEVDEPGCSYKHAECFIIEDAALEAVVTDLDAADYFAVHEVLTAGSATVRLDLDQGLIAFYGCGDKVAASIALTPAEVGALALLEQL